MASYAISLLEQIRGTLQQLSEWGRSRLELRRMYGIDSAGITMSTGPQGIGTPIDVLQAVYRRDRPISALVQLRDGLVPVPQEQFAFRDAAITIDTAGLINLSKHKSVETVLDYFQSRHTTKMLVSAQTILEFWNNHISAYETISTALAKRFADLEREIEKVDLSMGSYGEQFKLLFSKFNEEFGHLHDAAMRARLTSLASQLPDCAEVFEVPRMQFRDFAAYRKATKTPPGFKDPGDGDFYVWTDSLFGLLSLRSRGVLFASSIMVTDDRKSDWSKGGVAHPLLAAEVRSCVDVPFICWSVERFVSAVLAEVNGVVVAAPDAHEEQPAGGGAAREAGAAPGR